MQYTLLTSRANPAVAMRCPSGKKPAKSTPKVGRTGGGERRRKSECGSAERFVVSPEEVGSLCVISKVSSEAQRRLARSSDTRRSANAAEAARKQARVSEASVRLSGKQQSFSCCPVSSACACASAACVRARSSDNVQPTRHTVGTVVCEEHTTGAFKGGRGKEVGGGGGGVVLLRSVGLLTFPTLPMWCRVWCVLGTGGQNIFLPALEDCGYPDRLPSAERTVQEGGEKAEPKNNGTQASPQRILAAVKLLRSKDAWGRCSTHRLAWQGVILGSWPR